MTTKAPKKSPRSTAVYQLVLAARKGNPAAFTELLTMHKYLIESMARNLCREFPAIVYEDAEQASRMGFWNAVKDYSPRQDAMLGTHAFNRIRSQQNRLKDQATRAARETLTSDMTGATREVVKQGRFADLPPQLQERYKTLLVTAIAKLGPGQIAALREKFDLYLPGAEIKLANPVQCRRYYSDAIKTLKAAAAEILKQEARADAV